ncbi:MAG: hypothetical protein ABI779_00945 [Acidobacteriota bacterium]
MRRLTFGLILAVTLLAAGPLSAINTGGSNVILPVVGRFAGAGGTQWRTDVFLSNPFSPTQVITLKFYQSGGPLTEATVTLTPFSTRTLSDIVLNTFGLTTGAGVLEVISPQQLTIEARATIYNTGNPAGRFGQGLPGISKDYLTRQASMFGLSGVDGSRVNIGVANPNDVAVEVSIVVTGESNQSLHSRSVTVQPHSYVQYNDIFSTFGITPQAGVRVSMGSVALPIYGYSSEVRNDTGDAIFTFGTSPNS